MTKKRGLGRGLDALISAPSVEEDYILGLPLMLVIGDIKENPQQPRRDFSENELNTLADSIKARGILEPLLVRYQNEAKTSYELIAGERRLRAAKLAGLTEVPVIVRDDINEPVDLLEVALIENLCREDLNPMDEAASYHRLAKEFGRSQGEIAQLAGKDRSTITNFMRLLNLPEAVQDDVRYGRLSPGQGRALLALPDAESILKARQETLAKNFTVRQTEALVKKMLKPRRPAPLSGDKAYFESLETSLSQSLGLKVKVRHQGQKRLEISYKTPEELERLLKVLGAPNT